MSIIKERNKFLRVQAEIEAVYRKVTAEATTRLLAEINALFKAELASVQRNCKLLRAKSREAF